MTDWFVGAVRSSVAASAANRRLSTSAGRTPAAAMKQTTRRVHNARTVYVE